MFSYSREIQKVIGDAKQGVKSSAPARAVAFASQTRRIKMLELIPASAIIAIVVIAIIVIFLSVGYVKAPPDMAFIMFVV